MNLFWIKYGAGVCSLVGISGDPVRGFTLVAVARDSDGKCGTIVPFLSLLPFQWHYGTIGTILALFICI